MFLAEGRRGSRGGTQSCVNLRKSVRSARNFFHWCAEYFSRRGAQRFSRRGAERDSMKIEPHRTHRGNRKCICVNLWNLREIFFHAKSATVYVSRRGRRGFRRGTQSWVNMGEGYFAQRRRGRRGFHRGTQSWVNMGEGYFAQTRRGCRERDSMKIEPHRTHRGNRKCICVNL
jgi:hypothetical protein